MDFDEEEVEGMEGVEGVMDADGAAGVTGVVGVACAIACGGVSIFALRFCFKSEENLSAINIPRFYELRPTIIYSECEVRLMGRKRTKIRFAPYHSDLRLQTN